MLVGERTKQRIQEMQNRLPVNLSNVFDGVSCNIVVNQLQRCGLMIIPFSGFVTGWINLEEMIDGWYGPIESNEECWPLFYPVQNVDQVLLHFVPLSLPPTHMAWGWEEKLRSGTAEGAGACQNPCWQAGTLAQTQPDVTLTDVSKTVPSYSKGLVHKSRTQRHALIAICEGKAWDWVEVLAQFHSVVRSIGQRMQKNLECTFQW